MMTRRALFVGSVLTCTLLASPVAAQGTIKIVYPFPAGGAGDGVARMFADRLQGRLGQAVVVENKTGAGGHLGVQAVRDAGSESATLLFTAGAQMTLLPNMYPDVGYSPDSDFVPLVRVATFDLVVAVSSSVPARTIEELAGWLKANPEKAAFGTPGAGTGPHLVGMSIGQKFGVEFRHVPYRGTPPALPDLIAGRLPVLITSSAEVVEQAKQGAFKFIATANADRVGARPEVPALKESGLDIDAPGWFAFYASSKIPPPQLAPIEAALLATARDPAVIARIGALGFQPDSTTREQLRSAQKAESERWARTIKSVGYRPEQ